MKIVAKVLITNPKGEFLLLNRSTTHPNFPGHLDLPGGEVEKGEQWSVAVAREVKEETGINVLASSLTKVYEIHYPKVTHVLFETTLKSSTPVINLSWEHVMHKWFRKTELLQIPIPPSVDRYYSDVLNYLKE